MSDIKTAVCEVCAGTKKAECYSCGGHGILYLREDRPPTHAELEMHIRWLETKLKQQEERHNHEKALLQVTDREAELIGRIRSVEQRFKTLSRELAMAYENNHSRNVELDALHYVWCDGGCEGGVHRFDKLGSGAITEEIVATAEKNVARLRAWYTNFMYRKRDK